AARQGTFGFLIKVGLPIGRATRAALRYRAMIPTITLVPVPTTLTWSGPVSVFPGDTPQLKVIWCMASNSAGVYLGAGADLPGVDDPAGEIRAHDPTIAGNWSLAKRYTTPNGPTSAFTSMAVWHAFPYAGVFTYSQTFDTPTPAEVFTNASGSWTSVQSFSDTFTFMGS